MKWQGISRRKYTGAKIKSARGRRKFEIGRESADTHINEPKNKVVSTLGGNTKVKLLQTNVVNVTNPADGKTQKTEIFSVEENAASIHYVRRNIITKGAVIKTGLGNAKVTSRPGNDGVVNAILIE
jgi:small subunit ribosomal protein S8e